MKFRSNPTFPHTINPNKIHFAAALDLNVKNGTFCNVIEITGPV
jgi:hypothetical protein